ncbi:Lrp/AsnC family transcriptional regulator [Acinetobacter pittii]|uniref:Lrp/AsnC family transcriptional regulator n=1 Tax=Acinetobacter pittii TaxID=48296 RepID=UPI0034CEC800
MTKDSNTIQQHVVKTAHLDEKDRKILTLLSQDASLSYVELGKEVHLSPPSVHERVKKMKSEGVINGIVARLDSDKIGRPLLAFIHVDTTSWAVTRSILSLKALPEIEEIHTVAGDSAMLLKVRTQNTRSLESLLEVIHSIEGFKGTRSYIVLTPHLERGPSPELGHL